MVPLRSRLVFLCRRWDRLPDGPARVVGALPVARGRSLARDVRLLHGGSRRADARAWDRPQGGVARRRRRLPRCGRRRRGPGVRAGAERGGQLLRRDRRLPPARLPAHRLRGRRRLCRRLAPRPHVRPPGGGLHRPGRRRRAVPRVGGERHVVPGSGPKHPVRAWHPLHLRRRLAAGHAPAGERRVRRAHVRDPHGLRDPRRRPPGLRVRGAGQRPCALPRGPRDPRDRRAPRVHLPRLRPRAGREPPRGPDRPDHRPGQPPHADARPGRADRSTASRATTTPSATPPATRS
jgi:hypothetical protein